jgi:hypothetical protein
LQTTFLLVLSFSTVLIDAVKDSFEISEIHPHKKVLELLDDSLLVKRQIATKILYRDFGSRLYYRDSINNYIQYIPTKDDSIAFSESEIVNKEIQGSKSSVTQSIIASAYNKFIQILLFLLSHQ